MKHNLATPQHPDKSFGMLYVLNGGWAAFQRIQKCDPHFFTTLCFLSDSAKKNMLDFKKEFHIQIVRIDLCTKTTQPITKELTRAVKKGLVYGGGSHIHAIGELNNKSFSGKVGRQSQNYKDISPSAPATR